MKASDRYFALLLSAVGGGCNVWVIYEITVRFKCFANSSPLFEYTSLSRLRVLSGAMHTIHIVQQENEFNHEQICINLLNGLKRIRYFYSLGDLIEGQKCIDL